MKLAPALIRFLTAASLTLYGFALAPLRPACAADAPEQSADHALLLQLASSNAKLVARLSADETRIASLQSQLSAAQAKPATAHTTPDASSTAYGPFTVSGKDVYLTGYNLHIQSGSGSTIAKPNGYGKLIMGYNESRGSAGTDVRTGSHNIILRTAANDSSYSGIIGGCFNTSSADYATVLNGRRATASGMYSTVSSGSGGAASGEYAAISGGYNNAASGEYSAVGGGNAVNGQSATVSGYDNTASGFASSVSDGKSNTASGDSCLISGEFENSTDDGGDPDEGKASISGGYRVGMSGFASWGAGLAGNKATVYNLIETQSGN